MRISEVRTQSPWSFREKLTRLMWYFVQGSLFRFSPRVCYGWRSFLLRLFGAKVGCGARVRSTVQIEIPWNLTIGAETIIGDDVILYALGPISIGERTTISQLAHLCAGTHDYTRPSFPLVRSPITIGDDVWIAADVFVGPGVRVGTGTVVGARSGVFSDLPEWTVCVGTPAKPIGERRLTTT